MTLAICCFLVAVGNRETVGFQQKKRERVVLFGSHFGASPRALGGEVQTSTEKIMKLKNMLLV